MTRQRTESPIWPNAFARRILVYRLADHEWVPDSTGYGGAGLTWDPRQETEKGSSVGQKTIQMCKVLRSFVHAFVVLQILAANDFGGHAVNVGIEMGCIAVDKRYTADVDEKLGIRRRSAKSQQIYRIQKYAGVNWDTENSSIISATCDALMESMATNMPRFVIVRT